MTNNKFLCNNIDAFLNYVTNNSELLIHFDFILFNNELIRRLPHRLLVEHRIGQKNCLTISMKARYSIN